MRHRKDVIKLNRPASHRKAMLANMLNSLFRHERIKTTLAKAKFLRRYAEKIITKAKTNTLHSKRVVLRYLRSKRLLKKLFENIAPRYLNRPGGYTRIIKFKYRKGDAAKMAIIELVEEYSSKKAEKAVQK